MWVQSEVGVLQSRSISHAKNVVVCMCFCLSMASCHWPDCEVVCLLIVDRTNAQELPTEQRMKALGLGGIACCPCNEKGEGQKHSNLEFGALQTSGLQVRVVQYHETYHVLEYYNSVHTT